jgi:hypothetical protein
MLLFALAVNAVSTSWSFQLPEELGTGSAVTCTVYVKLPPAEMVTIKPSE